jgi:hypothetical protein
MATPHQPHEAIAATEGPSVPASEFIVVGPEGRVENAFEPGANEEGGDAATATAATPQVSISQLVLLLAGVWVGVVLIAIGKPTPQ